MDADDGSGLPEGSIFADEVGLLTGRFGGFRLKTRYQPIFRVSRTGLVPVGVEGFAQPHIDHEPVAPETFFASAGAEAQGAVRSLCLALQIGNLHLCGHPNPALHLNCDPGPLHDLESALAQIRSVVRHAACAELDPHLIVCGFPAREAEGLEPEGVLESLLAALRGNGLQIAVDDFGPGQSVFDPITRMQPDIVKIHGGWFRRIAEHPSAVRLLEKLVAGIKRSGPLVLIKGVETVEQMRTALAVGADLLQGYLLAQPFKAGTKNDFNALEIERHIRERDGVIVPLRASGHPRG